MAKNYNKGDLNTLLVVNKPMYISSNSYLNRLKKRYKNKKAGFSGTLDPFACGCLIVAFGQYTKLFKYLKKTPKLYRAVLWLGATSTSFDTENIIDIKNEKLLKQEEVYKAVKKLEGKIEYTPPKYSAKKIKGVRAYELARAGVEVALKKEIMKISKIKLICYNHPFITFEATVSEGSYIRSLAQILAANLGVVGTLSYLERLSEGDFSYENEKSLKPLDFLDLKINKYMGEKKLFEDGNKIVLTHLEIKEDGKYIILFEDFFSIISVLNGHVSYVLNRIKI